MKPVLLQQKVASAESDSEPASRSRSAGLPPDLLARATSRLRVVCLVYGGVALLYVFVTVLLQLGVIDPPPTMMTADVIDAFAHHFYAIAALSLLAATCVYVATLSPSLPPWRVMDLALGLQVIGALSIASAEHLEPVPKVIGGISWVCVWILSFNLVPATPRRAALGALLAASMGPLGLVLNVLWNHGVWPTAQVIVLIFMPNYVAAVIAVLTAAMVHRRVTDETRARRLGSYRLVEKRGQGGMGEVWRAEHRSLIRPAAVKVLRRDAVAGRTVTETEAMVRRFRREVQTTALLTSPHTVAVYDFGRSDEGTLYYVMELLHGIDLQSLVKSSGPQPAERVIHILRQVCHSLADAHGHGLVHRDIKPANIHLGVLGLDLDFVKVLDFGLVKGRRGTFEAGLTVQGMVQGTPAYLAPEAAVGHEVDARADLYAVGCVAYWMLTGELVFPGTSALAMLAAHVRKTPDAPSRRTELRVPPALDELVLACLAKDPADRPQSAAELLRRLDAIPVTAAWNQERAERWWRLHVPTVLDARGGAALAAA